MATWEEMIKVHPELAERRVSDFTQHQNGGWYEKTCRVTNSKLKNWALVKGYATVVNSILGNMCTIENHADVVLSKVDGTCRISDSATIAYSELLGNSSIIDNANIRQCFVINSTILGTSQLTRCMVSNATIDIREDAYGTTFKNDTFNYIPLEINNVITGYSITIDWNEVATTGCQRHSLKDWAKIGGKIAEDNNLIMDQKDVEEMVDTLTRLLEMARKAS